MKQQNTQENLINSLSKQQFHSVFAKSIKTAPGISTFLAEYPELFTTDRLEPQNPKDDKPIDTSDAFAPNVPTFQNKHYEKNVKKVIKVPKSPFTTSNIIADPNEKVWQYLDEQAKIKGPFSSLEMDQKYNNSLIGNPLRIRYDESKEFVKLIDMFGKEEESSVTKPVNITRSESDNNKKSQENVNIWEKIKPTTSNLENKPQSQNEKPNKSNEVPISQENKTKPQNNSSSNNQSKEETKTNEKQSSAQKDSQTLETKPKAEEKHDDKKKNLEENKFEKIEDKNLKISNNKSSEKSQEDTPSQPETSQEAEKKVVTPTPAIVDWSKEPSLLQSANIQTNDEGQGEWKISTLGKSKKKKGKKGKGQADEQEVPEKPVQETVVHINPEPKLPEPTHKVQEVIQEVKAPVIEKIPTPEPVVETPPKIVEETKEPIKEPENPKKTIESKESSKAQPAEKTKNTKPAKKRVIAAWTSDDKSDISKPSEAEKPVEDADFPSLGGPSVNTKAKPSTTPQKAENKEEKKQDTKPITTNTKPESNSKQIDNKVSNPVQNMPKTQPTKPAPKIKGTDWGTPVQSNSKKEQSTNGNGEKYEEEFPSL